IFVAALLVMLFTKSDKGPHDYGILQRCLEWAQNGSNVNYIGQRLAHRLILLATAGCVLLSPWLSSIGQRLSKPVLILASSIIAATLAVFFAASAYFWHERAYCLVLGIALILAAFIVDRQKFGWLPSKRDCATLMIALTALLFLPSLWLPPDFTGLS